MCKWEEGGEDLFHTEYDSNELIHDLNFRISIAIGSPNHITHKKSGSWNGYILILEHKVRQSSGVAIENKIYMI